MNNFLNTAWGSYVKAFLGIFLAYVIANGGNVFALGWMSLVGAVTVSFIPFIIKAITGATGGFFNTVTGGLVKTFVTVSLAYIVQHNGFVGLDWGALVNAGIMAVVTVLVNTANPNDPRYGSTQTPKA